MHGLSVSAIRHNLEANLDFTLAVTFVVQKR
jgi:hypothetical protein